jgi:hypothetical protein
MVYSSLLGSFTKPLCIAGFPCLVHSSALRACSAEHLPTPSSSVRHRMHARANRSASLTSAPALPAVPLTRLCHTRTLPACWARARLLLGRAASTSCTTCAFTRLRARARSRAPPRLPRTLRAPAVMHARAASPAPARASSAPEPRANA